MSITRLVDIFRSSGLNLSDVKIYVFLAKKGPIKAHDACNEMSITKQQLYLGIKNLQKKSLVYSTAEHPAVFYALPFEKALDMLVSFKIDEAQEVQIRKAEILSSCHSMKIEDYT
jgi:sugar-specific transcriptional regulator TrmB